MNTPTSHPPEPQPVQPSRSVDVAIPRAPRSSVRRGGRVEVDHCPACRVRRELLEHRDAYESSWSPRRAAFNFAAVLAARACPAYVPPARAEGDS